MQAIRGIQAFDACWDALKQTYPTSQAENTLLVQSMGRFVDAYGTQAEIRATLPQPLQILFDRLIDAYINGYVPAQDKPLDLPQPVVLPQSATTEVVPAPVRFPATVLTATAEATPPTRVAAAAEVAPASPRITATTLAMSELRRQLPEPALANEAETFVLDRPAL
ncbi:MAG: hypothetical protein AAFU71_11925 [Cyanobacteria bacterium J06632_22]